MISSSTHFTTGNGLRYKQALAKHFAHKISVEETVEDARFAFGAGTGRALVLPDGLSLTCEADDLAGVERIQAVFESHLKRFAFREPFDSLAWSIAGAPTIDRSSAQ